MERALNRILRIIFDMSQGVADDDVAGFFRGYLFALNENGEITASERVMLISFFNELVANKKFIAK